MFGRKKQPPAQARQRPTAVPDRRNAAVFSYHTARSARVPARGSGRDVRAQEQTAGAAAERRDAHSGGLKRSATAIAIVLLGGLLLSSLFLGTNPKITFGNGGGRVFLRDSAVYQQAAAGILRGSLFNRTKPGINTAQVAAQLQRQFPELKDVRISLPLIGYQPIIHVQAAVPALIMSAADGQSYVLATDGRALVPPAQAPRVGGLNLPVVTDQSGLPIHVGTAALPGSTVAYITEVAGQLRAAHLSIASLTLPKATSELDVRLDGIGYAAKFNLMGQARVEAGAFLATKAQLERQHITPTSYIDVRVGGRAYFK